MAVAVSYPGVYIEEVPGGVRTITGVATSNAVFVGWATKGPVDKAVLVTGWADYERQFGGLHSDSYLGYAVYHFFNNGGQRAYIVRVVRTEDGDGLKMAAVATVTAGGLALKAQNPGGWANERFGVVVKKDTPVAGRFQVKVYQQEPDSSVEAVALEKTAVEAAAAAKKAADDAKTAADDAANATPPAANAAELADKAKTAAEKADKAKVDADAASLNAKTAKLLAGTLQAATLVETFDRLSLSEDDPRYFVNIINNSEIIRIEKPGTAPTIADAGLSGNRLPDGQLLKGGEDGGALRPSDEAFKTAALASRDLLRKIDLFNILCVPGFTDTTTLQELEMFCREERAILIVDGEEAAPVSSYPGGLNGINTSLGRNAAFYFPWLSAPDALDDHRLRNFPPCGFVAGIYARTDATRGVWKAPAGTEATLVGVSGPRLPLTDTDSGTLNPVAVNVIRNFPAYGTVIWGGRTLEGADEVGSEWKYVPVRRTALFLEESLYRGLKWVVFEPNDEPLWAQIRLNVGSFMNNLFRQGAFQGKSAQEAYFVKCDKDTTTQNDINLGIVNILVGFAPLKPAEFVVVRLQQMAGQLQT